MIIRRLALVLALAAFAVSPAWAQSEHITGPQKPLQTQPLVIVNHGGKHLTFHVELAKTLQEQTVGLMFRKQVPADGGMLFVWGAPKESQMWMKNTLVPLDMVFINADGTIHSIIENTVPQSLRILDSRGPVMATLELRGGITAKDDIVVGDKVLSPLFHDMPK
ncbi:MAG TPA: DUF192 domain-containing protein [Acetobacteraceae bacterium]|nr:DUF192 domain-containing protein [Acetobacteraceae bacterium]